MYYFKNKKRYVKSKKVSISKIPYESHPYLPFILKKKFKNSGEVELNYPLKKNYKLINPKLTSNDLGYYNGEFGNKDVEKDKKGKIRVNCVGGSTTMNYLKDNKTNTSYPLQLQKKLDTYYKDKFEVNNFGQGVYTSAEVLIRFLTSTIYTKPDIVVLYIGYNDIRAYLTNNFQTDYSHQRKNLHFSKSKKFLNFIGYDFKLNFLNYILSKLAIYNIKETLTAEISHGEFHLENDPSEGLKTFYQNIESLISICKNKKIRLIMSSFCHYLYSDVEDDNLHKKYNQIIKKENEILEYLAKKNDIEFVDNDNLIEKNDNLFIDTIHFSVEGMKKLAENYANQIVKK
tara:strand:- start:245 stop:1276 length:1032 start_codon:yes stop_codon:yes gene_type:complete